MNSQSQETEGKASEFVGKAVSGAHETIDRVANATGPAVEKIAASAHGVVDNAGKAAEPAAQWAETKARDLIAAEDQMLEDAREYVRNRPITAILTAFAVGFLLSKLTQ